MPKTAIGGAVQRAAHVREEFFFDLFDVASAQRFQEVLNTIADDGASRTITFATNGVLSLSFLSALNVWHGKLVKKGIKLQKNAWRRFDASRYDGLVVDVVDKLLKDNVACVLTKERARNAQFRRHFGRVMSQEYFNLILTSAHNVRRDDSFGESVPSREASRIKIFLTIITRLCDFV